MWGEVRVRVVKEEMVRPVRRSRRRQRGEEEEEEEEEEGEAMFLSAIDILFRQMPHNRRVLFYDPAGPVVDHERLVSTLKRSLGSALDAFYPLAGRIVEPPGPGSWGPMPPTPLARGVQRRGCRARGGHCGWRHHARRSGSLSRQQPAFFDQLVPKVDPADYASVPPLMVQVSRFDCGGIALGIAHSHVVCDGNSLWHFMTSWAECARGEPISLPPLHARSLLKIESPSHAKARLVLEHVEDDQTKVFGKGNHSKISTFRFTIETLRTKVHGENTSYEIICAHIWKHATKARDHARDKKVAFISIVNMRSRAEPALGNAYFGNAMMWSIAVATAGELEDEDLAATARRIHKSIPRYRNGAFYDWLHWLELYDRDAIFRSCMLNGARIRASSSHNFPIYEVDFGWGKPFVVRCPCAEDAGKIIFFPGSDVYGNIDVVLALPLEVMNRLENDKDFTNP